MGLLQEKPGRWAEMSCCSPLLPAGEAVIQSWVFQLKWDVEELERVQRDSQGPRAHGLQEEAEGALHPVSDGEEAKEWFNGSLWLLPGTLWRWQSQMLLSRWQNKMPWTSIVDWEIQLGSWKNIFIGKIVQHLNKSPGSRGFSILEVFKDKAAVSLIWCWW